MWTVAGRAAAKTASFLGLAALLAGVPAAQASLVGWPLPRQVPTWKQVGDALASRTWLTDTVLVNCLSVLLWLLWALFAASVLIEVTAAARGITAPRYRLLAPTQGLAALLIAGFLSGTPAPSAPAPLTATSVPALAWAPTQALTVTAATTTQPPTAAVAQPPVAPTGPDESNPARQGPVYEVARGDWLWHISARFLGDPLRYPEIEALNPSLELRDHRFPDHIEATWHIRLPTDAHDRGPREHATGHLVPKPTAPAPSNPAGPDNGDVLPTPATPAPTTPAASPPATPPAKATPAADPDGVVEPAPISTTPSTSPATTTVATPTPPASATGPASSPAGGPGGQAPSAPVTDEHGVTLPNGSGWVPWTLAGALVAAAAMVWLQRRRTYKPRRLDGTAADERPDPPDLPSAMQAVQRAWRRRPDPLPAPPLPAEPTDPARKAGGRGTRPPSATPSPVLVPAVPAMEPLPPGGLGLTGPGAESAARGAIVSALAAGAPTDPDAQSIVVITVDDMITLLGAEAVTIGTWPRLRVAPDLEAALTLLETRLLGTARLLHEHDTTDLADLRAPDSTAPPLAPVLLVAATPPPPQRERCRIVLGLGQRLDVTAVLLGEWEHGRTVTVDPDGTCHPSGGTGPMPARLAVLDTATARDLLRSLREAHTGEPAQPAPPDLIPREITAPDRDRPTASTDRPVPRQPDGSPVPTQRTTDHAEQSTAHTDSLGAATAKVLVYVLGPPRIPDRPRDMRVRAYALELLAYLAVHSDGATSDQIMEDLWPDARRGPAAQRLHQATSNLRQLLTRSRVSGDTDSEQHDHRPDPLVKAKGRWRLNPDAVDVDLWRLRAAYAAARGRTGTERLNALRQVCQTYTGPLAGDEDYDWVGRHRQGVLGLVIDAHTALATALSDTDPAEALRLLHAANEYDPVNEDVACDLMRAQHRAGDLDAIRATVRRLKLALEEIGTEPSPATLDLVDELRRDLNRRTPGRR